MSACQLQISNSRKQFFNTDLQESIQDFRKIWYQYCGWSLLGVSHNKTSEHTAVPESTELTHSSIQGFPLTLVGKQSQDLRRERKCQFPLWDHFCLFFLFHGRRYSKLGKVRLQIISLGHESCISPDVVGFLV